MAKIHVIRTGYTLVSPAVPNRKSRRSQIAYTGLFQNRKTRIKVPVKCFLVEVKGRKVLVDAGWSKKVIEQPIKSIGFGLWFASEPILKEEETLDSYFRKIGIKVSDIDAVVFTHLDVDHVSGAEDVIEAKRFFASKEEIEAAARFDVRYNKKLWKNIHLEPLAMAETVEAPFGFECDLFGDGSIKVVYSPGHSKGHVAVIVQDSEDYAIISGDNGYNEASWNELLLPGPMSDANDMLKSLKWIQEQRKKENCIGVFAAHDPEVEMSIIEI